MLVFFQSNCMPFRIGLLLSAVVIMFRGAAVGLQLQRVANLRAAARLSPKMQVVTYKCIDSKLHCVLFFFHPRCSMFHHDPLVKLTTKCSLKNTNSFAFVLSNIPRRCCHQGLSHAPSRAHLQRGYTRENHHVPSRGGHGRERPADSGH